MKKTLLLAIFVCVIFSDTAGILRLRLRNRQP